MWELRHYPNDNKTSQPPPPEKRSQIKKIGIKKYKIINPHTTTLPTDQEDPSCAPSHASTCAPSHASGANPYCTS